jgi:hypothetical protein
MHPEALQWRSCSQTGNAMSLRVTLLLVSAFFIPGMVYADASEGDFMGYRLGNNYLLTAQTGSRATTNGNLSITAEQPVKPDSISEVTLITTPETLTIGFINASSWFATEDEARQFGKQYIELLRAKYPDWNFGRERMNADMRIDEVNLDHSPHNLQMRLTSGVREGQAMWRLSMTLRWLEGTKEMAAWNNMSHTQQSNQQDKNRKNLLKNSDIRGL